MSPTMPRRRATDGSADALLTVKLLLPRQRRGTVPRPQLIQLMARADEVPLILLGAPPGWGKTTLLAQWATLHPGAVAWVSLDGSDNDPTRFWTYVLTSLQQAWPGLPDHVVDAIKVHGADAARDVVPPLAQVLEDVTDDLYLVLDDYHLITSHAVHEAVAQLLALVPARAHVVVATRADPPLGIPQLRARGELLEIRAEQLRFTDVEAAALVNGSLTTPLRNRDVARLQERTEGWVAGLQLAALTLRDRADVDAFLDEFTGDDRHVVDYLVAEVLDTLPVDLRMFLLRTSVLQRLAAPLCEAVTDGVGAAEILVELDRRNLFLVPLDRSRRWFRYHHLFGELLQHELAMTQPQLVPMLHDRAAAWWETDGQDVTQAVHHAAAAGDVDRTRRLVATNWRPLFNRGLLTTVTQWIELLPTQVVAADEQLTNAAIWTALDRGDLSGADRWLSLVAAGPDADGQHTSLLRALHAFKAGDVGRTRSLLDLVTDEGDDFDVVVRHCLDGIVAYWSGDTATAVPLLSAAASRATLSHNLLAATYAHGYRALALLRCGDVQEARVAINAALAEAADPAVAGHFVATAPALAEAELLSAAGNNAAALAAATAAVVVARRGAGRIELAAVLTRLSALAQACGDADAAAVAGAEATEVLSRCADPGPLLGRPRREAQGVPTVADGAERLTQRELTVLRMLSGSATNRELASALYVSPNTVKTHLKAIYRKIGASTRPDAVRRARELGLLTAGQAR